MKKSTVLLATAVVLAVLSVLLAFRPVPSDLKSDGYFRGLSTNSTQTTFTIAAGRTLTKPAGFIALGQTNGEKPRYGRFIPFGAGSATNTFDYKVWAVTACMNGTGGIDDYDVQLFCSGTATLSSTAGVGTWGITSSDKVCDTLTVTTATYGTAIVNAFGGVAPLVFTGSAGAQLFIPETGNIHGFVFETDITDATSANYLFSYGV